MDNWTVYDHPTRGMDGRVMALDQPQLWRVADGSIVDISTLSQQHASSAAEELLRRAQQKVISYYVHRPLIWPMDPASTAEALAKALTDPRKWIMNKAQYRALVGRSQQRVTVHPRDLGTGDYDVMNEINVVTGFWAHGGKRQRKEVEQAWPRLADHLEKLTRYWHQPGR